MPPHGSTCSEHVVVEAAHHRAGRLVHPERLGFTPHQADEGLALDCGEVLVALSVAGEAHCLDHLVSVRFRTALVHLGALHEAEALLMHLHLVPLGFS